MRGLEERGLFGFSELENFCFTWRFEFSGKQNRHTFLSSMTGAGAGLAAQFSDFARPPRLLLVGRLRGLTVQIVLWVKYFLGSWLSFRRT